MNQLALEYNEKEQPCETRPVNQTARKLHSTHTLSPPSRRPLLRRHDRSQHVFLSVDHGVHQFPPLCHSVSQTHSVLPVTDGQEHLSEVLTAQHADRPEDSSRQLHQCAALSLCLPHRLLHRLSPSSCSIPPFQRRHARDSFQLRKIHETLGNTSIRTRGPPICRSS